LPIKYQISNIKLSTGGITDSREIKEYPGGMVIFNVHCVFILQNYYILHDLFCYLFAFVVCFLVGAFGIGAIEHVMEHIAQTVKKDPLEVRMNNMN
jgi:hypothetical protein